MSRRPDRGMLELLRRLGRRLVPASVRGAWVRRTRRPAVGRVDFGGLRRLAPVSKVWGSDRGLPIDRYYIEKFLAAHRADIRGRVLEIGDDRYTTAFGQGWVERSEVLHLDGSRPGVTLQADLTEAPQIADDSFDCILCTQTLQFIPDVAAAAATLHRILRPGGVLLATVPTLSRLDVHPGNRADDHWRFTRSAIRWLFGRPFEADRLSVEAYGNVLAATAFLHGVAAEELSEEELDHFDPAFELLVGVRAVKAEVGR